MKARRIVNDPVGVGLFNRQVLSRAITPVYGYTKKIQPVVGFFCDLGGARTLDPLIKSQLLYQLSYEVFLDAQRYNFFIKNKYVLSIFLCLSVLK